MTSRSKPGETKNCAPASRQRRASSASSTVPAPAVPAQGGRLSAMRRHRPDLPLSAREIDLRLRPVLRAVLASEAQTRQRQCRNDAPHRVHRFVLEARFQRFSVPTQGSRVTSPTKSKPAYRPAPRRQARLVRPRPLKEFWFAYPFIVTFVVISTGTHFWLDAFLGALEKANRRDLARFLLRAAHHLLGDIAHLLEHPKDRLAGQR